VIYKFNQNLIAKSTCPCCESREARVVSMVDGKTKEHLITIACEVCGLGRIDPLPSEFELEKWYKEKYRQAYKGIEKPKLKYVLRAGRNAVERYCWLSENINITDSNNLNTTVLDIGSSSGEFVSLMKGLGFDAVGIEPHQGYAEYAAKEHGLKVLSGSLNDLVESFEKRSLSLVTMFHVLEHLPEPVKALKKIANLLKQDGYIFIEVPNATRMTSPHYMFFKAHTLYFTHQTLVNLLVKSGYEVLFTNSKNSNNLRIIAKVKQSVTADSQSYFVHNHELIAAQSRRQWISYIFYQIRENKVWPRLLRRIEEKNSSKRYENGSELLKDLYRHLHKITNTNKNQSSA
jgi:2-polyprenyl-3-methyl-5-hydroxy-6-metoxy-1,4-benzoquinol methylase